MRVVATTAGLATVNLLMISVLVSPQILQGAAAAQNICAVIDGFAVDICRIQMDVGSSCSTWRTTLGPVRDHHDRRANQVRHQWDQRDCRGLGGRPAAPSGG